MFWETVKKEFTITRIMLALVAILLCCFLAFGLPHKTEAQPNAESGLEMLRRLVHNVEQNKSHSATPKASHALITTTKPKHHKFTAKHSSFSKTTAVTHANKNKDLNLNHNKHAQTMHHSNNSSKNATKPGLDIVLVFNMKKKPVQQQHKEESLVDMKDTESKRVDELELNNVVLTKTVRVSKVEEVFEDLVAQNVKRIIKEDRIERVEVAKNKKLETIGNDIDFDHLISI